MTFVHMHGHAGQVKLEAKSISELRELKNKTETGASIVKLTLTVGLENSLLRSLTLIREFYSCKSPSLFTHHVRETANRP